MEKEIAELNVKVASWIYGILNLEVISEGKYIYHPTSWNEKDNEWNIELVPDLTSPAALSFMLRDILPTLTARCYDPSISYDHEMDQWNITLHNWTSNSSKDSPCEYCKEASEIPLTLCRCIEQIQARRKRNEC